MSIITLTTDLGADSPYVAEMKGAILSICPAATIVDATHDVPRGDVRRGALVLRQISLAFPQGTIHVAVVDPGVGTERKILFARLGRQCYVAPDNGLLSAVAEQASPQSYIELTERQFWRPDVSATFHGRDVMAPVAAHLAAGVAPQQLGRPMVDAVTLDWPVATCEAGRIIGEVRSVDRFGNLATNIAADLLPVDVLENNVVLQVHCGGCHIAGLSHTYAENPAGTLIAIVGSDGHLEVAVNGGNAAKSLGIGAGAPVEVTW
jgi:S-adenosylmethionine hydrolase